MGVGRTKCKPGVTEMKMLGINDDVTTCECCGKTNLKCTVVLTNGEGEVHYGRDCAARALAGKFGRPKTAAKIEQEARNLADGWMKTKTGWVRVK